MKHHLVTLACTAAAVLAVLAAGLLLGPSPAEQPASPPTAATEAKADRLPLVRRYPEAPRLAPAQPAPAAPALPAAAAAVPPAPQVAELLDPAPGAILPARHQHTICDRYGMHKVWHGRRWRCRR